jgi:MFS family permease
MFPNLGRLSREFPRNFWVVVGTSFIDGIGGTLLFPFFALYITQKFHVGMTEAGLLLGMFSLFGLIGSMLGGALTDRFGRKQIILFGLVFSALSNLAFGLVNTLAALFPLAVLIGLLSNIAHPAHQAMIADILPEQKRQEGFGILRVAANLSWIIGPTIGGIVAAKSFFALFVIDAVVSCMVAVLIYLLLPETKPAPQPGQERESIWKTFTGYGQVIRDRPFVAFLLASILMMVVYQQMYNSLSVYLRDNHGIDPRGYGYLLTTSAITVVLFQFWVTRLIKNRAPFAMMALGTVFYMIGFSMFGLVSAFYLFALAIVVITIGEMIAVPTSQALAAHFAPEEMRGRYMAVFGLIWALPATIGPGAAGLILDNFNPNLLWYIGGILCAISAIAYYSLHLRLGTQERFAASAEEEPAAAD